MFNIIFFKFPNPSSVASLNGPVYGLSSTGVFNVSCVQLFSVGSLNVPCWFFVYHFPTAFVCGIETFLNVPCL